MPLKNRPSLTEFALLYGALIVGVILIRSGK